MASEHVRAIATAAATLIQDDDIAFKLLLDEFTGSDSDRTGLVQYCEHSRSSLYDNLLDYILIYFDRSSKAVQAVNTLRTGDTRDKLIQRFLDNTYSQNISMMINRPSIVEAIKSVLRRDNKAKNTSRIESNRISVVVQKYSEWFAKNSAISFERVDSFEKYAVSAFKLYFYPSSKKDIWDILNENDAVKDSVEFNRISNAVEDIKTQKESLYIRDYIRNIRAANIELFEHNGNEDQFGSFVFELYYAVILELCGPVVANINSTLCDEDFTVKLVDMKDMTESTSDIPTAPYLFDLEYVQSREKSQNNFADILVWQGKQRSRSTKVKNAKEILRIILPFIKSRQLSVSQLSMIRSECFDGRYCKLESQKSLFNLNDVGESYSLLNEETQKAIDNINKEDQILMGVISAYSMMVGLEERGIDVIETYRGDAFLDPALTRHLDYESSLQYIDVIKEMQDAKTQPPIVDGTQLMRTFDDMVYHYVGSPNNGKTEFRLARAEVCNYGFNEYTRLKTDTRKTQGRKKKLTQYEHMNAIFCALECLPVRTVDCAKIGFGKKLTVGDIGAGRFTSLDCNYFFLSSDEGRDYLNRLTTPNTGSTWDLNSIKLKSCEIYYIDEEGQTSTFKAIYDPYALEYVPIYVDAYTPYNAYAIYGIEFDYIQSATQLNQLQMYASTTQFSLDTFGWQPTNNGYTLEFLGGFLNAHSDVVIDEIRMDNVDKFKIPHLQNFIKEYGVLCELHYYLKELLEHIIARATIVMSSSELGVFDSKKISAYSAVIDGMTSGTFNPDDLSLILSDLVETWNTRYLEVEEYQKNLSIEAYQYSGAYRSGVGDSASYAYMARRCNDILGKLNADLGGPSSLELILFLCGEDSKLSKLPFYSELLCPLLECETAGARLISLMNLVSVHTKLWKVLRDAYQLIVGIGDKREMVTFTCELESKLRISDTLNNLTRCVSNVTLSSSSTSAESRMEVSEFVNLFSTMHGVLIQSLIKQIQKSTETFATLLDYSVTAPEIHSKFSKLGNTFDMLGHYKYSLSIGRFIRNCDKDSAGFLMRFGKYLIANVRGYKYYIHRTGRVLRVLDNGELEGYNLDITANGESELYKEIFKDVM